MLHILYYMHYLICGVVGERGGPSKVFVLGATKGTYKQIYPFYSLLNQFPFLNWNSICVFSIAYVGSV